MSFNLILTKEPCSMLSSIMVFLQMQPWTLSVSLLICLVLSVVWVWLLAEFIADIRPLRQQGSWNNVKPAGHGKEVSDMAYRRRSYGRRRGVVRRRRSGGRRVNRIGFRM